MSDAAMLSVVIPTYRRGQVVLDSLAALLALPVAPAEILVVDQTPDHPDSVTEGLEELHRSGSIRWLRLTKPSIPGAMNEGLRQASGQAVLFLDDDILPDGQLIAAHAQAQGRPGLVAGQVLQPGQTPQPLHFAEPFRFNSTQPAEIGEFMGGNFSVNREMALSLGGFDENFVGAAYRFEAEFAFRYVARYGPIRFEPGACIHHLAISTGGTRAHGHHLRTMQPAHSVGAYYYWLTTKCPGWWWQILWRPLRAVRTLHHLRRPWWIPLTLVAEVRGLVWAWRLSTQGQRLISPVVPVARGDV